MPTHGNLRKYIQTIGDGAQSRFVVTHGLGNRHSIVQVRRHIAPYDVVGVSICLDPDDLGNNVIIDFGTPPRTEEFVVIVIG